MHMLTCSIIRCASEWVRLRKMWVRAGRFEAGPFVGRIHTVVLLVSLSRQIERAQKGRDESCRDITNFEAAVYTTLPTRQPTSVVFIMHRSR